MGDQLGGPGYALLRNPSRGHTNPSGEAGLSGAAAEVTTAAWLAFLCPTGRHHLDGGLDLSSEDRTLEHGVDGRESTSKQRV